MSMIEGGPAVYALDHGGWGLLCMVWGRIMSIVEGGACFACSGVSIIVGIWLA